jgi:hypothetical protein
MDARCLSHFRIPRFRRIPVPLRPAFDLHRIGQTEPQQREQIGFAPRGLLCECLPLVAKHPHAQTRVGHWVVHRVLDQAIVLDQGVIRNLGKSQRRQEQRVDHRQSQQPQARSQLLQDRPIVRQQIVAGEETGIPFGDEPVQIVERLAPSFFRPATPLELMRTADRTDLCQTSVAMDLQVQKNATFQKLFE